MKNTKPHLVLKPTGIGKQYYVDNGFYENRFELKNVYEPANYCHFPQESNKNRFVFDAPAEVEMEEITSLPIDIPSEFATEETRIADQYIKEARSFAEHQLIELEEFKSDVKAGNRAAELLSGPDYQQMTRDLLTAGATEELTDNAQEVSTKYSNMDEFQPPASTESPARYRASSTIAASDNLKSENASSCEKVEEKEPIGHPEDKTLRTEVYAQENPFYAPSQPVPDYIKELTTQYYNGALMLEEAHQRQLRIQDATHFAAMLQTERNTNRHIENGATKTINGLLSRVQELEVQLLDNKTYEQKERLVNQLLEKKADELRKSGLLNVTAPGSDNPRPPEHTSPETSENQMLMQENLLLQRELQELQQRMEQYKEQVDEFTFSEQQKENSITETQNLSEKNEEFSSSSSSLPPTPVHPQARHVKKTPLQREGSAKDMRNISPQNLLVAPTVEVVKELTAEEEDRSISEKLSKSMSPPAKTPPILPAKKSKQAADLVKANFKIEHPKCLKPDAHTTFEQAVEQLIDGKKSNIINGMKPAENQAQDSLEIELSDDTIQANEEWQNEKTSKEDKSLKTLSSVQLAVEDEDEEDFDLDIPL